MTTLAPEHTVPTTRTGGQRTVGLASLKPCLKRPVYSCGKRCERVKSTMSENIGCEGKRQ
jgi:hypothetical protein